MLIVCTYTIYIIVDRHRELFEDLDFLVKLEVDDGTYMHQSCCSDLLINIIPVVSIFDRQGANWKSKVVN